MRESSFRKIWMQQLLHASGMWSQLLGRVSSITGNRRKTGDGLWSITWQHFSCQWSEKKNHYPFVPYQWPVWQQAEMARSIGNLPGPLTLPCLHGNRVNKHFFVQDVYGINRNLRGEFSFCCLKISIYLGRLYQACCWVVWKWEHPCSVWRKGWRMWLGKGHESALILGYGELPSLPPPTMVKTFLPPPYPPPLHSRSSLLQRLEKPHS